MYKTLISAEYSNWQLLMVLENCTAHQISFGDEIKEEHMGAKCRTYTGKEKFVRNFGGATW